MRNCFLYCIHDIFGIITKVFLYSPAVQWAIFMKQNLRFRLFWASSSVKIPVIMLAIMITKGFNWIKIWISRMSSYVAGTSVTIMSPNDELSSTMNWVGCLLKDSELFILFAENSQILFKISVFPILLYSLKDIYWGLFHIETFLKKIKKMQGFSDEDLNPRTLHVRQQNIDNYINVIIEIKRYITLCCCHFFIVVMAVLD